MVVMKGLIAGIIHNPSQRARKIVCGAGGDLFYMRVLPILAHSRLAVFPKPALQVVDTLLFLCACVILHPVFFFARCAASLFPFSSHGFDAVLVLWNCSGVRRADLIGR